MQIPEEIKQQILDKATLENTLNAYHSFKKKGSQKVSKCPKCGKDDKLNYSVAKEIVSCFVCEIKTKSAADYLIKFQDMTYPKALEELARIESIEIERPKRERVKIAVGKVEPQKRKSHSKGANKDLSFCDRALKESGLVLEDVTSEIAVDQDTKLELSSYVAGSVDERFEIIRGDDMIIRYYDLDNKPMEYYRTNSNGKVSDKKKEFFRVRFQNPDLHKDRFGRPVKYKSPYGSDIKVYLPKILRTKFQAGSKIKTLYLQEGEKKADKATKHGMTSVGIMGIHNIAYQKNLPYEFERIIRKCNVENVVFVLDQDWDDIGTSIDSKHAADARPKSFFRAVCNFRDYFYAFTNNDIHLQIFFGYVNNNPEKDKGVDDLLTKSLKHRENELQALCEKALIEPNGDAKWIQFHKITTVSEFKLKEYWGLKNKDTFINKYSEQLKKYPEFVIGKLKWRFNENGEVELAQPLMDHQKFWEDNNIEKDNKIVKRKPSFNHARFYNFLKDRGYGLYALPAGEPMLICSEGNVISEIDPLTIRHFTLSFTKTINNEQVLNLLYSNAKNFFGKECLYNMEYMNPKFHENSKGIQYLYFEEKYWRITKSGIEEETIKSLPGQVWKQEIKSANVKKTTPLLTGVRQIAAADCKGGNSELKDFIGEWVFDIPSEMLNKKGKHKCDFLQFIINTSQFYHDNRTRGLNDYSLPEKLETTRHVLSKLTSMGYLLHNYRDSGVLKAVIAMDGKMSEVGSSNGRSGKSLIGMFLKQMITTVTIPGKKRDLLEDRFLWEEVDERTRLIFIDDVLSNFNLEYLFPNITGEFSVEKKGQSKFTLSNPLKFYITTNHALKGEGGSFKDRQVLLGFSDWYNENHKPDKEIGYLFFDDWDESKWNLAYNLSALCLELYFKHGIIQAPVAKLERRRLRQEIGEEFLDWAEEFYSRAINLNTDVAKSHLYKENTATHGKSFLGKHPRQEKYVSITLFKKKLINYCKYKDWKFNPVQNGGPNKSNGTEYIQVEVPNDQLNIIVDNEGDEVFSN